jgi:uncharacterized protein YfdQ (DUF2303 family)
MAGPAPRTSEAEVVEAITTRANRLERGDIDGTPYIVLPSDYSAVKLPELLLRPTRAQGTVTAHSQAAVRQLVEQLRGGGDACRIYVDLDDRLVVAVLNDDEPGKPAWRDHRIWWKAEVSRAWRAWKQLFAAGYVSQETLGDFVEDWRHTITSPDDATLLELVRNMEGHSGAEFRSGQILADGSVQFSYVETVRATAKEGTLEVPGFITLFVELFKGEPQIQVVARLRYRIKDGRVGFRLMPGVVDDLERAQMIAVRDRLVEWGGAPIVEGRP